MLGANVQDAKRKDTNAQYRDTFDQDSCPGGNGPVTEHYSTIILQLRAKGFKGQGNRGMGNAIPARKEITAGVYSLRSRWNSCI